MSAETADDRAAGPTTRYRVRCPGCGYSDRFRSKGNAIRVQKHGCPDCGRGVGVSKVRADPDNQQLVTDGGLKRWIAGPNEDPIPPRYDCLHCGASYYNQRVADECCMITDGGIEVEDPGDFEPSGVTDNGETETFYQVVCVPCGREGEAAKGEPHQRRSFAEIEREIHQQLENCENARVRTFESEPIGSLPREKPPVETDDA